jgi:ribosome maturation factor RimP
MYQYGEEVTFLLDNGKQITGTVIGVKGDTLALNVDGEIINIDIG